MKAKQTTFFLFFCCKPILCEVFHRICHIECQGRHSCTNQLLSFLMIICITCVTQKRNPMITMVGINRYGYVNHD